MKRHNPGCNCCERILVWDLGAAADDWDESGPSGNYEFFHWTILRDMFRERKIRMDFVTGQAAPPQTFYQVNPGFDPYTTAVEAKNWTGNIFDYKLIYWPFPTSSGDLDTGSCTPDFPGDGDPPTAPGFPDHEHFGGVPEWWDDVASGAWQGRLVWLTEGSAARFISRTGLAANLFLNTLTDVHGMEIDTSAYLWPFFPDTSLHTIHSADLTDGVGMLGNIINWSEMSGGECLVSYDDVFVCNADTWCSNPFEHEHNLVPVTCSIARNTIHKPQPGGGSVAVDFVISVGVPIIPSDFDSEAEQEEMRRLNLNFYRKAVA